MHMPTPPGNFSPSHIVNENSANDSVEIDLIAGYAQRVNYGVAGADSFTIDEPEPLGTNTGPSPTRVLAAALGSCLGASLLFCLKKAQVTVSSLHTRATVTMKRNEHGRLRIGVIDVTLNPVVAADQQDKLARCLLTFEDYCIVTASLRPAVTVNVTVNAVTT